MQAEAELQPWGGKSQLRDPRWTRSAALVLLLCLPALIPIGAIVLSLLSPSVEVWRHLGQYVLPHVLLNTVILVLGVTCITAALGTSLAWLCASCEFPGRRWFEWALLLPLAIPTYVLAFVAVGFLDFAGPLQTSLREIFGTSRWVPPIRSTGGTIMVMSLALYPYVYLMARSAFLTQGRRAVEAAQSLGLSRAAGLWHVALPMARPWIAAGAALVAMETLADFGAVSVFNYDTFTTAIYRAWRGMFSMAAALELAGVLMVCVLVALYLERRARAGRRFTSDVASGRDVARIHLGGWHAFAAGAFSATILLLAFVLPMMQLLVWTVQRAASDFDARYLGFVLRSLMLASSGAVTVVAASLILVYIQRRQPPALLQALIRVSTVGYAIPGTVLAVGLIVPVILFSNALQATLTMAFGSNAPAVMLHGTIVTILAAYMARFLAVGFHPIESGLQRITRSTDEAAVSLGVTGMPLLTRVHLPLMRTSLATAATLVFVDIMKEMPITLITRPFGWDTLAVRVFEMTSEGEWERAALPAVAIVLAGLIPTALLTRRGTHVA